MRFLFFIICSLLNLSAVAEITIVHSVPASGGECNGAILLQVTGNAGPFDIAINGEPYEEDVSGSELIQGLCSGDYVITVMNNYQCETTLEVDLKDCPGEITITDMDHGITMPSACGVDDGSFYFTHGASVTGGTGSYTTILQDEDGDEVPSNVLGGWENLSHGNYAFHITDANNCQAEIPLVLAGMDLEVYFETYPECENNSNGEIQLQAYNPMDIDNFGVTEYNYTWSNGVSYQSNDIVSLENLSAGEYTVTVTDLNGECEYIETIEVIGYESEFPLSVSAEITNPCFNKVNGIILLNISGGVPNPNHGAYTIRWDDGAKGSPRSLLPAGEYEVTVTDFCGNSMVETYTLEATPEMTLTLEDIDHICPDETEGAIDISVQGDSPFSYQWYQVDDLYPPISTNQDLSNQPQENYVVYVFDKNGCKIEEEFEILSSSLDHIIDEREGSCEGLEEGIGSIRLDVNTPFPPYYFQWSHENATTSSIEGLHPGLYDVTITDAECTYEMTYEVVEEDSWIDYGDKCWETVHCGNAASTYWRPIQQVSLDENCRAVVLCENAREWYSNPGPTTVEYEGEIINDEENDYKCTKTTFCNLNWSFVEPNLGNTWEVNVVDTIIKVEMTGLTISGGSLGEGGCEPNEYYYEITCGGELLDTDCRIRAFQDNLTEVFQNGDTIHEAHLEEIRLLVYPSPFTNSINIEMESYSSFASNILILDPLGQVVSNTDINVERGINKYEITDIKLPVGVYYVVVKTTEGQIAAQVIKI